MTLDFPGGGGLERLRFPAPDRLLVARDLGEVRAVLRAAEHAARAGAWVPGFLAYEAAPAFDAALTARPPTGPAPLAWFAICPPPAAATAPPLDAPAPPDMEWAADTSRTTYTRAIRSIREAIAAGDVYQVNHTLRLTAPVAADVAAWYDAVVARRHGRYNALIETAAWSILSASPELFLDIRGGTVTTRPMKGTARRGRWLEEDRAARERLAGSEKDRAENLMIVDLLRNDLGRIARFGTVEVPAMFDVESYPTVLQMTSTITAERRADASIDDVFAATFPCGSVTGAPKVTAMRAIAALESSARGPYCGAVGVFRPDGSATFNVAIRTLLIDHARGTATYGVGGGITWDSAAAAEYDEAISKAALLHDRAPPFRLLETMRLDDGTIVRLERNLARLAESAEYFGFCTAGPAPAPANGVIRARASEMLQARARAALLREAAAAPAGRWRLRLLADRNGHIDVQRAPLAPDEAPAARTDGTARRVAVAAAPVDSSDPLLCHKTTARAVYDAHRAAHADAFDVLLHNEHGFITEFCTGNCVLLLDGYYITPPRAHGLLAGTFRAELIEHGAVMERAITLADVQRAAAVWLINSVREWVRVRPVGGHTRPNAQPLAHGR